MRPATGDVNVYPDGIVIAARLRPCPEYAVTTSGSGVAVGGVVGVGVRVAEAAGLALAAWVATVVARGVADDAALALGVLVVVATVAALLSVRLLTMNPATRIPMPIPIPSTALPTVCMSERTSSLCCT